MADETQKPQVSDAALQEMVSHIQDPAMKAHFENVIGGVIQREVVCLNTADDKGVVIAHYYADGQLVEVKSTEEIKDEDGYVETREHGCTSSRQRTDKHMGYSCRCGNWSIQSKAEQGIISEAAPSRDDLAMIYERLQDKPTEFKVEGDSYEVDAFLVRPYTGGVDHA